MKRTIVLLITLLIVFVLFGCNVAPNVPRVTPYATNGTYYNNAQGNPNNPNNPNNRGTYNMTPGGMVPNNNLPGGAGANNNIGGSRSNTNRAGT